MKARGRPRHPETLTPRQQDVLALLRRGLTNEEIAQQLGISVDGVKYHVSDILMRLNVSSRYEAAQWQPRPVSRWHAFGAPFAFMRKLRWGVAGQAAGALVVVGLVAAVALFGWAVLGSDDGDDESSDPLIVVPGKAETGNAALDTLIDLLEAQDVDALLQRVSFAQEPCDTDPSAFNRLPSCPLTIETGADAPSFPFSACGGVALLTSADQIRPRFAEAFENSERSSVYAVAPGTLWVEDREYNPLNAIILNPGKHPSPLVPATIWYADDSGRITQFGTECPTNPTINAALRAENESLGYYGFVIEPRARCKTGAASTTLRITIVDTNHGDLFMGEELNAFGEPTGGIVIINVVKREFRHAIALTPPPTPAWRDGLNDTRDLAAGMLVHAEGERHENCEIDAHVISRG